MRAEMRRRAAIRSRNTASISSIRPRPSEIDVMVDTALSLSSTVESGADMALLEVCRDVADGAKPGPGVFWNLDAEAVFDRDSHLDHRQRVEVEILGQRLVHGDLGRIDAGHLLEHGGEPRDRLLLHGIFPSDKGHWWAGSPAESSRADAVSSLTRSIRLLSRISASTAWISPSIARSSETNGTCSRTNSWTRRVARATRSRPR